jgi:hypothetical protein
VHPCATAQVGIRTENPQGLLYIDARGDTQFTPDTANFSDDVVFTTEGRLGLGILKPQALLDIRDTVPAIRIEDGTQGPGKVLAAYDAAGSASWISLAGNWYAVLRNGSSWGQSSGASLEIWPPFDFISGESSTGTGEADSARDLVTVPYTATYRITVTGKSDTNRYASTDGFLTYMGLKVVGTVISAWAPHTHSYVNFGQVTFGFMTQVALNAGSEVWMEPNRGNSNPANLYTDMTFLVELVK